MLKQLTRGLADSPNKLRQLIKGKLSKMACEPRTMQVCLQETMCGIRIGLQDAKEIFLDLAPKETLQKILKEMSGREGYPQG